MKNHRGVVILRGTWTGEGGLISHGIFLLETLLYQISPSPTPNFEGLPPKGNTPYQADQLAFSKGNDRWEKHFFSISTVDKDILSFWFNDYIK